MSAEKNTSRPNEGIIANTVTADVLAVGKGATATKYQVESQVQKEVLAKLDALIDAINKSSSDDAAGAILTQNIEQIKAEVEKPQPDKEKLQSIFSSLGEKFVLAKNILKDSSEIINSVKSIASLLKIPLSFLI